MAFGLEARGLTSAVIAEKVARALDTVRLTGLGVERWLTRLTGAEAAQIGSRAGHQASPYRFRSVVALAWITAVVLNLLSWLLHTFVFDPPLNAMLQSLGITIPGETAIPPLYGLLAAISAGINEEIEFRLFGLSVLGIVKFAGLTTIMGICALAAGILLLVNRDFVLMTF